MGCVAIGDLRAYLDGELRGVEQAEVEQHLAACYSCRGELESLRSNASLVGSALEKVAPVEVPRPDWTRLRSRAGSAGRRPVTFGSGVSDMFGNLSRLFAGSRVRIATGTVAALLVVGLVSTFSPVQTAASSFLSIFRVNKFVAVTIDPKTLPNLTAPSDLGKFTVTGDQKARAASVQEAEKEVGFKVKQPQQVPADLKLNPKAISVTGAHTITFVPDLQKVRAYLSSIGANNVKLPDNLDGAPITLQVPAGVMMVYTEGGAFNRTEDGLVQPSGGQRYLFVGATSSPTMHVPEGVNVEQIRNEILKIPGLPPDLVSQIQSITDWQNTVVVPVVKGTSRNVTVQGAQGVLITEAQGRGTTIMWQSDGVVHALTGNLSESEMLKAANSLQ